jgi:EmrB/QacA subfamily drug resistance transporter
MTTQTNSPVAPKGATRPIFVVPFIVAIAFLMEALDSTIIISALPNVAADFGVEPIRLNLAITAYALSLAAFIPASGWLADRLGARKLFVGAIFLFMGASIVSGLSQNLPMLICSRVAQGIAGAMMTPIGRLLIIRSFDKKDLASAIAYLSMPVLIGPILGPLLGGLIVNYTSWRWIFFINIPIGILGVILTLKFIQPIAPEPKRPFDFLGFILCALGLSALQFALEDRVHPLLPNNLGLSMFALAALIMLGYWLHARRKDRPALEINLFKNRLFGTAFSFGGLSRIGLNSVPFILQLQLQLGFGYSALEAGSLVFLIAFGALLLKPMTKAMLKWFGFRALLSANALVGGILIAGYSLFDANTNIWVIAAYTFVFGFTRSLQFNAINALLYADLPRDRQSAGAALGGVGQQIAMGLGISLSAVAVASLTGILGPELAPIYSAAFIVMAAITFISGFGFLLLKNSDGFEVSRHWRFLKGPENDTQPA